jgi:hypothetical protein
VLDLLFQVTRALEIKGNRLAITFIESQGSADLFAGRDRSGVAEVDIELDGVEGPFVYANLIESDLIWSKMQNTRTANAVPQGNENRGGNMGRSIAPARSGFVSKSSNSRAKCHHRTPCYPPAMVKIRSRNQHHARI